MNEPTTPTGKALWERLTPYYPPDEYDGWAEWVAAIEAEAAGLERERLRDVARAWHAARHRSPPSPARWEDCDWQPCPDRRRLLEATR